MSLTALIPDADVIIRLHKLDLWDKLCQRTQLVVPSIIVHEEALFFTDPATEQRIEIHLPDLVGDGVIIESTATAVEMGRVATQFDPVAREGLHAGELEALTLLYTRRVTGCWFCSGDGNATRALVLLGLGEWGLSLEEALRRTGLCASGRLPHQFSEETFRQRVQQAQIDRLQGTGLALR